MLEEKPNFLKLVSFLDSFTVEEVSTKKYVLKSKETQLSATVDKETISYFAEDGKIDEEEFSHLTEFAEMVK